MGTSNRSHRSAFSLIELVIVIAIIAITGIIAAPKFAASMALYHTQAAAQRVAADIDLAQWKAKTSSAGQTIVFNAPGSSYTLPGVAGLPGTSATYTVNLTADPYDATIVSATFGSGSTLTYDRYGQPAAGGTVVVQSGADQSTITVDANTGKASVQ